MVLELWWHGWLRLKKSSASFPFLSTRQSPVLKQNAIYYIHSSQLQRKVGLAHQQIY